MTSTSKTTFTYLCLGIKKHLKRKTCKHEYDHLCTIYSGDQPSRNELRGHKKLRYTKTVLALAWLYSSIVYASLNIILNVILILQCLLFAVSILAKLRSFYFCGIQLPWLFKTYMLHLQNRSFCFNSAKNHWKRTERN